MDSVEGSPDDAFPSSQPIQDIHFSELPLKDGTTGGAVLGVGMAGKGHWSASHSIELTQAKEDVAETRSIRSDLACLLKSVSSEKNVWLGSTYKIDSLWNAESNIDESGATQVELRHESFLIRCFSIPGTLVRVVEKEDQQLLVAEPMGFSGLPRVATRWTFDIVAQSDLN